MVTSTRYGRFKQRVVNLPVGRKMFIGFGALTCVLALVIGCLFFTVARLGAANNEIVTVAAKRVQSADELRVAAAELHASQQSYVFNWPAPRTGVEEGGLAAIPCTQTTGQTGFADRNRRAFVAIACVHRMLRNAPDFLE